MQDSHLSTSYLFILRRLFRRAPKTPLLMNIFIRISQESWLICHSRACWRAHLVITDLTLAIFSGVLAVLVRPGHVSRWSKSLNTRRSVLRYGVVLIPSDTEMRTIDPLCCDYILFISHCTQRRVVVVSIITEDTLKQLPLPRFPSWLTVYKRFVKHSYVLYQKNPYL